MNNPQHKRFAFRVFRAFVIPLLIMVLIATLVSEIIFITYESRYYARVMEIGLDHIQLRLNNRDTVRAEGILNNYIQLAESNGGFVMDSVGHAILGHIPEWCDASRFNNTHAIYYQSDGHRQYVMECVTCRNTGNRLCYYVSAYEYFNPFILFMLVLLGSGLIPIGISIFFFQKWIAPDIQRYTAQNEKMRTELQIAHKVQQQMVPNSGVLCRQSGLNIYGMLKPALDVAGDLYDYVFTTNYWGAQREVAQMYFCIGDVSDKGVPASLMMAMTQGLFHHTAEMGAHLVDIVPEINRSLCEHNPHGMFCTFFAACLNLESYELRYINAGHNPLLLNGRPLSMDTNLPLGIDINRPYPLQSIQVNKGDTLVLYTDGITEAINEQGQFFGLERLVSAIDNTMSADGITHNILDAVTAFRGRAEQNDDMTLLTIKI